MRISFEFGISFAHSSVRGHSRYLEQAFSAAEVAREEYILLVVLAQEFFLI